jgi:hypothetical protein
MPTHATALFGDRHTAHAAVEQLVQAGFPRDDISIVMSEAAYEREFAFSSPDRSGVRSGVLCAIVAGLVALASPGGMPLRAAGPFVSALVRSMHGAAQGDFATSLGAAGLADPEATFVDQGLRTGAILVAVHATNDRARLARQLLELSGGAALQAA